jgi:hypothetical protein
MRALEAHARHGIAHLRGGEAIRSQQAGIGVVEAQPVLVEEQGFGGILHVRSMPDAEATTIYPCHVAQAWRWPPGKKAGGEGNREERSQRTTQCKPTQSR